MSASDAAKCDPTLRVIIFVDLSLVRSTGYERIAGCAEEACYLLCCSRGVLPSAVDASTSLLDSRFDNDTLEVVPQLRQAIKARDPSPRQLQHLCSVMHRKLEKYADVANFPTSVTASGAPLHTCVIILSSLQQQQQKQQHSSSLNLLPALEQCVALWKDVCEQVLWVECGGCSVSWNHAPCVLIPELSLFVKLAQNSLHTKERTVCVYVCMCALVCALRACGSIQAAQGAM
eukprot:1160457-Pelagomonas_calceolata.AAC.6